MATYRKLLKNRAGDTIIPVVNVIYPVGSIYMSATMRTVAEVEATLGGTWVKWGAGRVPVGVDTTQTEFNTVEETGGEKTHTLTIGEMPSHNHTLQYTNNSGGSGTSRTYGTVYSTGNQSITENSTIPTSGELAYWGIQNSGGGGGHNNLPPYITCYMYKRTA